MPRFYFETDAAEPCPLEFGADAGILVYFLSLAFSTRYGSLHPLSQLALLLRGEMKIDLGPLTTFADRDVEVEADQAELGDGEAEAGAVETVPNGCDFLKYSRPTTARAPPRRRSRPARSRR